MIAVRGFSPRLFVFFILLPVFLPAMEDESRNRVIQALNGISGNIISIEERSLLAGYGGFGSSVLARNSNANESDGSFVLAVPLYAEFAVDTAIALAEKLDSLDNRVNVLVAFLGDERNALPEDLWTSSVLKRVPHKGLRDLITLAYVPENWVLCYFDAEEAPEELVVQQGRRKYIAPLQIIKPLPCFFASKGIPWSFRIRHNTIFELGLLEGSDALFIAWNEEINGFALSGRVSKKEGAQTISPEALAEALLEYSVSLDLQVLNPDRHYSLIPLPGGKFFFADEVLTVALVLLTACFFLFLYLLYSARHNAAFFYHIRLFIRSFWIFFIFLPLLVISIKASGFFYSLLLGIFNVPSGVANNAGVGLTLLLAIFVFFLPAPALNLFRFPKRARFYGFSAVIFVIFGILSVTFLDFSFVSIFLWALFFVFLGVSVSNPILVFLCALLIPLFASGALINLIEIGSGRFAELFFPKDWNTLESWGAALLMALFSLPVFLLVKRGRILLQRQTSRKPGLGLNHKLRALALPVTIISVLLIMVLQVAILKYRIKPEKRIISEIPDTNDPLTLSLLSLSLDDTVFQNSRIISLHLEAQRNPERFDVFLESENGKSLLPVYSAPVPVERDEELKRIDFSLGEYPPNPLVLEFVLPLEFEGRLTTAAIYHEKTGSEDYFLRVSKSRSIATSGIQH